MTVDDPLEAALARDPHDPAALVAKADRYAHAGDARAASAFYSAALRNAGRRALTPDLRAALLRAQNAVRAYSQAYETRLDERLRDEGFTTGDSASRFGQSLDLMFGRTEVQLQQPSVYYFPELPQVQFYHRATLDWAAAIEAETPAIRAEAERVLDRSPDAFQPYVQAEADRPRDERRGLRPDPGWTAWHLWRDGAPTAEGLDLCPVATRIVEQAPLCRIPGRTPSVLFSLLRPGATIPPHHGFINTRLICHLPLIVPEGCGLRVGNQTRSWTEGELLCFDDTISHEAWNRGDSLRLVLIFDVWRPELTEQERRLVSALFETADAFGVGGSAWRE